MKVHDHRKIHNNIYKGKLNEIEIVEVPNLQFIAAEGIGSRNVYEMHNGDVLWSISRVINRLKDMTKTEMDYKFTLMPLEIIWSQKDLENDEIWSWKAMMQVPDLITEDMFQEAILELEKRKRSVRVPLNLEKHEMGLNMQTIHLGPYHQIQDTIDQFKSYCTMNGYKIKSQFREIYINQPYCNVPEKLQTIVRAEIESTEQI
ncbi:hypothetical protein SAMN05877753_102673 [Bacillus oleivorans]|uniref:Uncharacterized protein n=1 Tax=Bacillus oleivorans TaxID=1448271 RepID=A0A285CMC6_9BACI|nr:GyrI-like domain-containing protein [Bacillus oleivorans]SNX68697.1 hypothetical protein SAMN05877753_102673 [Bacillus oleivorans]